MSDRHPFHILLLQKAPALRGRALRLTSSPHRAENLDQDTLLKAWAARGSYRPGTNLGAWPFNILRNTFISDLRKFRRDMSLHPDDAPTCARCQTKSGMSMTSQQSPTPMSFDEARTTRRRDDAAVDPRKEIDKHLRPMRAFARCLTRDSARGDALVCDTVLRAWASIDTFEPGAHVGVWLFSIERNIFYAQRQKPAGRIPGERLAVMPDREGVTVLADFRRAFDSLPDEHREALTLVGAAGFSPRQAADICGCPVDILTDRATRGRRRLAKILSPKRDRSGPALIGVIGRNP